MDNSALPLGLLGLDEPAGTKAPETRLTNGNDARRLFQALLREDNNSRSLQRALVKGMVDGNPPYDDAKRREQKRGWECNLNFGEGQAIMNRTAVPYYNLFARVDYFADCCTAYQPEHPDHELWSKNISRRFHNMLKRWREFNWNVQQISYWMRLHGIGFAYPDRDGDWRFRALETGAVLVPKNSPSSLDHRVPYVAIRIPMRILELWEKIKNPEAAKEAGCNVEAIRNAIKYGMRGMLQKGTDWYSQSWEYFERILKNGDLNASFTDSDVVNCVVLLIQEFCKPGDYNGKISKFIISEVAIVSETAKANDQKDNNFLFCDPNCYDSYLDALIPFFRNTGDGTWHSVRGYAMEAFKHLEVDNRLLCQMINRAFLDSSLVLQNVTGRGRERFELAVWGTVVQLPGGAEFKPTTVQGGTDGPLLVHRVLSNHLAGNLGTFSPRSMSREDGRGEQPTAEQVQHEAASEASIGEGEITIWYEQLDSLYQMMYMRASDPSTSDSEAKRFQKECLEDGVPKEALRDMEYIRANRQNGYGSPQMGLMKMKQGMELVPMLPEDGKQHWLEDAVTVVYGPDKAKRYAPRTHLPDDQDWQATVENGMIAGGRLPEITTGQDDVIHLTRHFEDAQKTLGPVAQSLQTNGHGPQPLQVAANYAAIMGQHVEQHIARLQSDPTRRKEAKMFEDQFLQLSEFSKQLFRALRAAHRQAILEQEQAAQATALSALDRAKVESVRTQAAASVEKTRSQIANQTAKTQAQLLLKGVTTSHNISTKERLTQAELRSKSMEVPAELAG